MHFPVESNYIPFDPLRTDAERISSTVPPFMRAICTTWVQQGPPLRYTAIHYVYYKRPKTAICPHGSRAAQSCMMYWIQSAYTFEIKDSATRFIKYIYMERFGSYPRQRQKANKSRPHASLLCGYVMWMREHMVIHGNQTKFAIVPTQNV